MFIITILLVLAVSVVMITNRPYTPISFVVDGENWSATIENGGELILVLDNGDKHGDWMIVSHPEVFVSDYDSQLQNGKEYHVIALDDGNGDMEIHFISDDNSIEKYTLTLSVFRHKKHYLQIDSVSFRKNQ